MDLGLESVATLATATLAVGTLAVATLAVGTPIATPRSLRVAHRPLKRAQRRVSRRLKGSHRRRTALRLLAKAHQQLRRARTDFHPQSALALLSQYDTLAHEAVQTATMLRNHHLAKSIADAGCSAFLRSRSCPAVQAGKTVVAVPPAYPSHACSGCGVLV